jgi:microcystin-dependent protein
MSRVQTDPNYFLEVKQLQQQVAALQRATVQTTFYPGDIITTGTTSRVGCLLCDGSAYLRSLYPNLFYAIGTTYGVGNGVTTFNVPDLRGRTPMGAGTGSAVRATTWSLGQQPVSGAGGEQSHVQQASEMAYHGHDIQIDSSGGYMVSRAVNSIQYNGATPTGNGIGDDRGGAWNTVNYGAGGYASFVNGFSGGGAAANIQSPVSVVNFFIFY